MEIARNLSPIHFITLGAIVIGAWVGVGFSTTAIAQTPSDGCRSLWNQLQEETSDNLGTLRSEWQAASEHCGHSGYYYYKLQALHASVGKRDLAKKALRRGIDKVVSEKELIELSLASLALVDLIEGRENESYSSFEEIRDYLTSLDRESVYPGLTKSYLAQAHLYIGNYARATETGWEAIKAGGLPWKNYHTLVIAYANLQECEKAVPLIRRTAEARDSVLGESNFMFAAAFCYMSTGQYKTAKAALRVLAQRNPATERDDIYVNLMQQIESGSNE